MILVGAIPWSRRACVTDPVPAPSSTIQPLDWGQMKEAIRLPRYGELGKAAPVNVGLDNIWRPNKVTDLRSLSGIEIVRLAADSVPAVSARGQW